MDTYIKQFIDSDEEFYKAVFHPDGNTRDQKFYEEHHFAVEETWDLYNVFAIWLYSRIKGYIEYASSVVDIEYHKFEYEGSEYTQKQLCEMILEYLEFYFHTSKSDSWEIEDEGLHKLQDAAKIWAVILPAMWW